MNKIETMLWEERKRTMFAAREKVRKRAQAWERGERKKVRMGHTIHRGKLRFQIITFKIAFQFLHWAFSIHGIGSIPHPNIISQTSNLGQIQNFKWNSRSQIGHYFKFLQNKWFLKPPNSCHFIREGNWNRREFSFEWFILPPSQHVFHFGCPKMLFLFLMFLYSIWYFIL